MLIETYINSFVNVVDFFKGVDTDRPSVYIEDCIARQDPLVEVFLIFCTFVTNVAFLKLKLHKNGVVGFYEKNYTFNMWNVKLFSFLS